MTKEAEWGRNYRYSKRGVVNTTYSNQKQTSKRRGHKPPEYTREELLSWLFAQDKFHTLYDAWVASGYIREFKPSVDRLDDTKGYSFSNIQLMTWKENRGKGHKAYSEGLHGSPIKPVIQYSIKGVRLNEYKSLATATAETGVAKCNISLCCNGVRKSAGGFAWSFK